MHPQQLRVRLNRQVIVLCLISASFPLPGYCIPAGRADFVIGNVEAVAADGARRPLAKGSEISAGDAINTAAGARAQVRFADGGYVSLQPNTLFRVDEFNYKNKTDGEEKGFFSLLKGGLRAITGAIGHVNRNTYKVATPSATIGIRGTGYKAEIRDEGLFVSVGEGAISLTNKAGLLVVTAGGAAFVANSNTAPAPSSEQPRIPPASLQPLDAIILPILPSLASGSGYVLAYANSLGSSASLSGVNAVFSSTSQLTQYSGTDLQGLTGSGALGAANVAFSATDGIIGWGRWVGYITGTTPLSPGVFDYVVGIPTAVMPTTGTATYNLMGYTSPMATNGSSGYSVNGTLSVNFASSATVNMTVANSANSYVVNGAVTITGQTFSGSGVPTSGGVCSTACTTSVNGFFAGTNAARAGLSYSMLIPSNTITGVAVFARQ